MKDLISYKKASLALSSLSCGVLGVATLSPYQTAHAATSFWSNSSCLNEFYKDTPPYLVRDSLKKNTTALCFHGFNVMYSGMSKTPLWSAEHLTVERLSHKIKRQDSFHEEERISPEFRATLRDYKGTGFDRGHMSPNGDMPDMLSQADSFSLANMVPQAPKNNQDIWRKLEEATRSTVTKQKHDAYVITGPIFSGRKLSTIGNGVFVPSAVFKAVYYPQTGVIGAYYAPNNNSLDVHVVSVCEIEDLTGINLFPTLNESTKRKVYNLPLMGGEVKPAQKASYLSWDAKSECADRVSEADIQAAQKQFHAEGRTGNSGSVVGNIKDRILQFIKQLLPTILEFILKMLKT
ncbi:DNA/RNA non-specific endonuclease [Acinetobacter nectaris]|uniref:DNA/RNA non-specific endonuclease n=1 Tax=Acinetobacter nectaris TaxID=1219382 RepID=UPI001EFF974E|nr:DNA/RNA non-specific endonuclease [Acinetobacter nectaris]MCF8999625.1 DNA/RNA non-specific endonuclease [Acinetobacter nectaris]MCF9028179.1 DNA/RNA non-specific endonuclease [Acinetobacter nectaris]